MNVFLVIFIVLVVMFIYAMLYSLCVVAGRADDAIEQETGRRMS